MERDEYLEAAVRDVLTGEDATVDRRIGHAALLLATAGAPGPADRVVTHWQRLTERPVTRLADDAVRARAWAMLAEARGVGPQWAEALSLLDLDAEERAHEALLARRVSELEGVFDGSPLAGVAAGLAPGRADPARVALAEGDLGRWAELVAGQANPDVATLGATRPLAPRLVAGADPLGLGPEWPGQCAGALVAALSERYPSEAGSWPELVAAILRLRGRPSPGPAAESEVAAAEARLGVRFPGDYREFLRTADGLPADVVFPRLLPARELRADGPVVIVSEPALVLLTATGGRWRAVEVDPVFGSTAHPSFRALLEQHLRLLEAAA
ncbi:SMI1/KNR4 family protein [Amycolatopsis sp. PS_44_ISF1]|uniref:SMI1/KNR4 family protein n=1 Tax=Amycolatopsis sp. PS_44_ISF1 TaxID=2974917 RepID=UPI0028DDA4C3|nr:SMI1/KNR4 family protein [Amycolatopsis sp. PS_44_ISF1]MDT8914412.1 SMI1/KNR4 family protein [Amycolatopsis sp. PS_44_ISF1]